MLGNWGLFCVLYVYMLVIFNLCLMVLWFELREVGPWCNCQVPCTQKKKMAGCGFKFVDQGGWLVVVKVAYQSPLSDPAKVGDLCMGYEPFLV